MTEPQSVEVERVKAAIRMLTPDHITAQGARVLHRVLETEHEVTP